MVNKLTKINTIPKILSAEITGVMSKFRKISQAPININEIGNRKAPNPKPCFRVCTHQPVT